MGLSEARNVSSSARMERLDRFDEEQAEWEAKKLFVNTVRAQTRLASGLKLEHF